MLNAINILIRKDNPKAASKIGPRKKAYNSIRDTMIPAIVINVPLLLLNLDEYKLPKAEPVNSTEITAVTEYTGCPKNNTKYFIKTISKAYDDGPVQIGYGQTISQPYIVAFMTEVIQPKENFSVLEVGTGSGYQAAVLSEIVRSVYSIEIIDQLYKQAKTRLALLNCENVHLKNADGYYGWEEKGPFDAIIVTAAAEFIPPPLIKQLKEDGKMIIPIGKPFSLQQLLLLEKKNGKTKTKSLMFVRFVPFTRNK
jgi:protein-L-isoaspartate(D-aspartate) O-methyltransferase